MPRPPSPASRHRGLRRPGRSAALLSSALAAGAVASWLVPYAAFAAGDPPANVLDTPIVDAAFVDRGAEGPPDVLTLSVDSGPPSAARLILLQHGGAWTARSQQDLPLPVNFDGFSVWLTEVSPTQFVSVAETGDGTSSVRLISVDEGDAGAISIGEPTEVPMLPTGAGIADVDGDGTPELVLAGGIVEANQTCQPSAIAVLELDTGRRTIEPRAMVRLKTASGHPIAYFSGIALGQWDARPGADLLANAFECGAAEQLPFDTHHVIAIRLADLKTIKDLPTSPDDASLGSPSGSMPAVIDMDHDGRNEAVLATSAGVRVIDPENGWTSTTYGATGDALVAAMDRPDGTGTSLVFLRYSGDSTKDGVVATRFMKEDGTIAIHEAPPRPLPWLSPTTLDSTVAYLRDTAWPDQPPVPALDVDGDSCPDLLMPRALLSCRGTGSAEPSPAWTGTRPLAVEGGIGGSLLVADALDWGPSFSGLTAPSPAAVHPAGTWRPGIASRFILAEVPLAADAGGPRIPVPTVPAPTIVHARSADGHVDVERPAGTRLLARITAFGDNAPAPGESNLLEPDAFMRADATDNEWFGLTSSLGQTAPRPDGTGFGSGGGQETLELQRDLTGLQGLPTHWVVTLAALDASGTVSSPVQGIAAVDTEAPPLRVDVPFTSAPWPFSTTVRGVSEAGATVSVKDGASVTAAGDGSFELPVQLAPWPQTIDVVATDEASNATASAISVMGGIDIRGLPWPGIGVAAVLVAVVFSSIRGVRSGERAVRPLAVEIDDENATVIEELSAGRIDRRD